MLKALQIIAERRIAQAVQNGELKAEGWKGRPLPVEDEHLVPADMRMAFKILKNAGYLPPEIEARKEMRRLEELLAATKDEQVRLKQMQKLKVLELKLSTMRCRPLHLEEGDYHRRVVEKISVSAPPRE